MQICLGSADKSVKILLLLYNDSYCIKKFSPCDKNSANLDNFLIELAQIYHRHLEVLYFPYPIPVFALH